jgi:hypothetical protein
MNRLGDRIEQFWSRYRWGPLRNPSLFLLLLLLLISESISLQFNLKIHKKYKLNYSTDFFQFKTWLMGMSGDRTGPLCKPAWQIESTAISLLQIYGLTPKRFSESVYIRSGVHPIYLEQNGEIFSGVKRPGFEADHSDTPVAKVSKVEHIAPISPHSLRAWCVVNHRDNFTFWAGIFQSV